MATKRTIFRPNNRAWWKQGNAEEACQIINRIARANETLHTNRRERARKLASLYEGMQLTGLDGSDFVDLKEVFYDGMPISNNRAQAIADTLQAKIASLDEPRPQFVVTDGTYEQKRQAVWLDRFVEGQCYQRQGMFRNIWDLGRHAFLLASAATGTSAVKVYASKEQKRVVCELHNTLDMWIDINEIRYGQPMTYGETTWVDVEQLAMEFPEHAQRIYAAAGKMKDVNRIGDNINYDNMDVCVDEVWRIKSGDTKGKHAICVGGEPLVWEDYEFDSPPFAFYHFRRRLAGFWAAPMLETNYRSIIRENQIIARMDLSENKSPLVMMFYDPNLVPKKKIVAPKDVILIPYDSKMGSPPLMQAAPWFHNNALQLIDLHGQNAHNAVGVSEMQTTSRKEAGLDSGVAIRTVLSLLNERFAPRQRDIVDFMAVEIPTLIARAARELNDALPNGIKSLWHGENFTKNIPGKDALSLPDEIYTVRVAPVSEKKNSPGDRIQLATELVQQGIITGGEWLESLRTMDTTGATRRITTVTRWCNKLFDKFLYSPRSEMLKPGFYVSPPKYMDLDYAMALATDAYLTAMVDDVPDERRKLFLKFMADVSRKIDQRDMRKASLGGVEKKGMEAASPDMVALGTGAEAPETEMAPGLPAAA